MSEKPNRIPKRLWILWYQGLAEAPFVVRECVRSWKEKNPQWQIVVLDDSNLHEYVRLDCPREVLDNLSPAHRSDLVRLKLLAEYGGVWADATTFCVKPLNDWLSDCARSGFFAFRNPGKDRILSNWFLASEPGSPLVVRLYERLTGFWNENRFGKRGPVRKLIVRHLKKRLNRQVSTTKYWFSPFVTRFLRVYPYFVFHYMFERLVASDPECRLIWQGTPSVNADGPIALGKRGLLSTADASVKREINSRSIPVYKLTWKIETAEYPQSSILHYLLNAR